MKEMFVIRWSRCFDESIDHRLSTPERGPVSPLLVINLSVHVINLQIWHPVVSDGQAKCRLISRMCIILVEVVVADLLLQVCVRVQTSSSTHVLLM